MEIPIPALRIMGWVQTPHLSFRANLVSSEVTWYWDPARVPGRGAKEPGRVCSSGQTSRTEPSRCPIKAVLEKMKWEFAVVLPARVRGFAVSDPLAQSSLQRMEWPHRDTEETEKGGQEAALSTVLTGERTDFPVSQWGRKKPRGQGPAKKI